MTDRTRGKKPLVLPVQNPEGILRKPATPKPAIPKPTPAQIPDCTDFGHLAWHRHDRDKFTNNHLTLNQAGEVVNRACARQPCPNQLKYPPPEIVEKIDFQWQYCSNENYREVEQEYKSVEPFAPTSPVASASSTKPITSPPVEPTAPATPVASTPAAPKPPANNPPSDPPSSPEPESPPAVTIFTFHLDYHIPLPRDLLTCAAALTFSFVFDSLCTISDSPRLVSLRLLYA